jgi:predicted ATPase
MAVIARMTVRMLLRHVKLENLLSFWKTEVELRGLNVLIGANASGKSNLIEAIGLPQAAPVDLSAAIRRLGGVHVACSLAKESPVAAIECDWINDEPLKYRLEFSEEARGFIINIERFSTLPPEIGSDVTYFLRRVGGSSGFGDDVNPISPTQSLFELYKTPADPTPTTRIGHKFRGFEFTVSSAQQAIPKRE